VTWVSWWVSTLAYPTCLGLKGYVVVVAAAARSQNVSVILVSSLHAGSLKLNMVALWQRNH